MLLRGEYIPKLNTRLIYTTMWLRTFEKLQDTSDPDHMFKIVRVYYEALIPPFRTAMKMSFRFNRDYNTFFEIIKVEEILASLPENQGKYLAVGLKKGDVKVLEKYGVFTKVAGDTYYIPTRLSAVKYITSIAMFGLITKTMYKKGVLTSGIRTLMEEFEEELKELEGGNSGEA